MSKLDILERLRNDEMVLDAVDDAIDEIVMLREKVNRMFQKHEALEERIYALCVVRDDLRYRFRLYRDEQQRIQDIEEGE